MTLAFDQLPHSDSWLGRVDPRWKLAAFSLAVGTATVLQTTPAATLALAGALTLVVWGRLPCRWYLARLGVVSLVLVPFVLLLPLVHQDSGPAWHWGPVRLSLYGLSLALLLGFKALTLVTLMLVLLVTSPLHVTFQAAQALYVPGLVIQLAMLTYRYVFVLAGELARLRIALRVRGYRNRATLHSYRTIGHVTGTLLVRGSEQAERIGQAMRCRGFDGRFRSLAKFQTRTADVAAFLLIAGGSIALLVWDRTGW